jgi:hypothetical protein
MKDPLAVESFEFKSGKTSRVAEKTGSQIIVACHEVITEMAANDSRLELRLVKTYRRGEKFSPCLAFVADGGSIDDSNPLTVYVRPGLRNFNQGFNPERKYSKLYVASGLTTTTAYFGGSETFDKIETSIMTVRNLRRGLNAKLGGLKLKDRRLKCVLCSKWVIEPSNEDERPRCLKHGINPPMWLAVDNRPSPPPAAVPALVGV